MKKILNELLLVLLAGLLASCHSHRESVIDYQVESSDTYRDRRMQQHEQYMESKSTETRDTLKQDSRQSGTIEYQRDTTGQIIKIIYEQAFSGINTRNFSGSGTGLKEMESESRDSEETGDIALQAQGKDTEKSDSGIGLPVLAAYCLLMCILVMLFFAVIKRWINRWRR